MFDSWVSYSMLRLPVHAGVNWAWGIENDGSDYANSLQAKPTRTSKWYQGYGNLSREPEAQIAACRAPRPRKKSMRWSERGRQFLDLLRTPYICIHTYTYIYNYIHTYLYIYIHIYTVYNRYHILYFIQHDAIFQALDTKSSNKVWHNVVLLHN